MPIPVPPSAEQARIVAAIEEQFSRLDAGVAALEAARIKLESLRKAIITAAVPEIPTVGWTLAPVGEVGEVSLGRQRAPKFHRGANMRPYLRVANVFENRIDTSDVMEMHFSHEEFEHYRLLPGDVLLNEGQSPHLLGRPAIYRGDPPNVAFTNTLIRFRPALNVTPEWALLVFRRHMHARRFMRESRITTNIAHLSAARFKAVEFPVPPLREQRSIVAAVDAQLSIVRQTEVALCQQTNHASVLRSSILSAAFSGQLVPQDPSDEPASLLLERIAAERAASNGHQPTRKTRAAKASS